LPCAYKTVYDVNRKRKQKHIKGAEQMSNLLAKQGLTAAQLAMVQSEMNNKQKSKGVAFALWWFLGIFGGHRFYAGDIGIGVGMLLTFGGFGIWTLIDGFFITSMIERKNMQMEVELIEHVKIMEVA
jgi:TM2 domain-containing membrane protein YozV